MQSMCFHEAEKLNAGSHSKTFLNVTKTGSKGALGHTSLPHKTSKGALAPKLPHTQQLAAGSTSLAQASAISVGKAGGGVAGAGQGSGLLEEESQKDLAVSVYVCVHVFVHLCTCM